MEQKIKPHWYNKEFKYEGQNILRSRYIVKKDKEEVKNQ